MNVLYVHVVFHDNSATQSLMKELKKLETMVVARGIAQIRVEKVKRILCLQRARRNTVE